MCVCESLKLLALFAYSNLLINHANLAQSTHHTSIRRHATQNKASTHILHGDMKKSKRKSCINSMSQLHSMRELGGEQHRQVRVHRWLGHQPLGLFGCSSFHGSLGALSQARRLNQSANPKVNSYQGFWALYWGPPFTLGCPECVQIDPNLIYYPWDTFLRVSGLIWSPESPRNYKYIQTYPEISRYNSQNT